MMSSLALFVAIAVQDPRTPDLRRLPEARVFLDSAARELVFELPVVPHLASVADGSVEHAHAHDPAPPVSRAVVPISGSFYGFRIEVMDGTGRRLPADLIHHINLIDPSSRELFAPISRRLLAAGRETGAQRVPRFMFGVPLEAGQRLVVVAVLHNRTGRDFHDVRVRLVLLFQPDRKFVPLFAGSPFQLDVAFPVGDKSFDLPPGRTERSYEASPAVRGRIVAIGGHLHDYGRSLELSDVTTGETVWRVSPVLDSTGGLIEVPVDRLYGLKRLGIPVHPDRRYRVTVVYENPTGEVLRGGGMGVVGGLFVPDRDARWPTVDVNNELYWKDLLHATRGAADAEAAPRSARPAHAGHAH